MTGSAVVRFTPPAILTGRDIDFLLDSLDRPPGNCWSGAPACRKGGDGVRPCRVAGPDPSVPPQMVFDGVVRSSATPSWLRTCSRRPYTRPCRTRSADPVGNCTSAAGSCADRTERFFREAARNRVPSRSTATSSVHRFWRCTARADTVVHFIADFDFGIPSIEGILDPYRRASDQGIGRLGGSRRLVRATSSWASASTRPRTTIVRKDHPWTGKPVPKPDHLPPAPRRVPGRLRRRHRAAGLALARTSVGCPRRAVPLHRLVGYLPGAIAFRRSAPAGSPRPTTCCTTDAQPHHAGRGRALWAAARQAEWALMGDPVPPLGDRGVFGNFLSRSNLPFERTPTAAYGRLLTALGYRAAGRGDRRTRTGRGRRRPVDGGYPGGRRGGRQARPAGGAPASRPGVSVLTGPAGWPRSTAPRSAR